MKAKSKPVNEFYRIMPGSGGLVNVYLTPGEPVPMYDNLTGRMDYSIRLLAVCGVDPADPQWEGDLEEHIRRHYAAWLESAEETEI